ncbi:hypothetical protein NM688_g4207 [Phlebia brevispora]|uniref:Uncharacterized protein n=1 Tax=Phlebia brevispora TaxID=194682 RepID=A0ACC1T464_9APHY|nr:hypothetical protein NM688_g4207 [Phlebia brevispora]
MTVDIQNATSSTEVKVKKSKKSKSRGKVEAIEKGGHGTESQYLGDEAPVDKAEKKDKKRKHKKEPLPAQTAADGEEASMVVDTHEEVSKHHKKKRKHEEESTTTSAESKKARKKRRKSLESSVEEASPEASEQSTEKKEKKHKKDKKRSKEAAAESTEEPVSAESTATSSRASAAAPSKAEVDAFLQTNSVTIHGTTPLTPIISFDDLDIPSGLRAALDGFKEPTPIQACSWPAALAGQDVVGIAETGSGKTLAFGLPALARILTSAIPQPSKGESTVSVLVVAPTRELAIQTHDTLTALGEPFGISSVAVFGGVDKRGQIDALRNISSKGKHRSKTTTRIIVGTPGRILDLVNDGLCDLSNVRYLVLDEADRMLDKGFENDIRSIIGYTQQGETRQTLMFSATWPDAVRKLAASFQRDPVRVTVGSDDLTANSRVEQVVEVFDESREKDFRLLRHLRELIPKKKAGSEETRILVFALYKKEADRVEGMLRSKGFSVGGLHGDMSQSARMDALQNFKTGKTGLLVATDVAARGLDIPNVAAARRGGKSGKSITFFTGDAHERSLAGELARVLHESGFESEGLKKFPMTIKKKTHSAYGAFFRDDIPVPAEPTKIVFD